MPAANDFAYALERLKRFNQLVEDDVVLSTFLIKGEYDFLQMYQPLLFLDFRIRAHGGSAPPRPARISRVTIALTALVVVAVSLISYGILVITRQHVLIFSGDRPTSPQGGDFRLAGVYAFLAKAHIPYIEIFYTTLSRLFFKHLATRGRPAMYLEAVDAVARLVVRRGARDVEAYIATLDLGVFGEDAEVLRSMLRSTVRRVPLSLFRIRALAALLRPTAVRALLTIDNVRHYHELVAACKKVGIHTYAFQHGQFGKYQVGWLQAAREPGNIVKPEKLVVWSEYWRDELTRLGTYFTPGELFVGGQASGGTHESLPPREGRGQGRGGRVLVPFETDISRDEVLAYMAVLRQLPDTSIYFKPRADRSLKDQLATYGLVEKEVAVITDTRHALTETDVVLGSKSTFLYDAIAYGKPVVFIKTVMDHAAALATRGLVSEARTPTDLPRALAEAARTPQAKLERRKERLVGGTIIPLEATLHTFLVEAGCLESAKVNP